MIHSKGKLSELHPVWRDIVVELLQLLDNAGIGGTVWTVYRDDAEQNRRFALGETNARAGESPHNVRIGRKPASLAFDFVVSQGETSQLQRDLQAWWGDVGLGIIRGGVGPNKRPDLGHVEVPNWRAYV